MPVMNTVIVSGGSQPTPTEKYPLFSRVKDDTNTNIGTVAGYFTDANNHKYAVVALDNGGLTGSILSVNHTIPGLTKYIGVNRWCATETATYENQCIIDEAALYGYTTVCSNARLLSYTIDGTTYYGQVPNIVEMVLLATNNTKILDDNDERIVSLSQGLISTTYTLNSSSTNTGHTDIRSSGIMQTDSYTSSSASTHAHAILEIPIN